MVQDLTITLPYPDIIGFVLAGLAFLWTLFQEYRHNRNRGAVISWKTNAGDTNAQELIEKISDLTESK